MNSGDYYIEEPTPERQNYQLTPSLVTNNANGEINIVDYCDFINSLKLQGVDTNNINRIIDGKYWSWSPLINIDMFLNYNYYYWVEEGPTPFVFEEETDAKRDIIGKQDFSYTYKQTLGLDVVDTVLTLSSGMRIMFTNDVNTEFNNNIYIVEGVGDSIQYQIIMLWSVVVKMVINGLSEIVGFIELWLQKVIQQHIINKHKNQSFVSIKI